MTDRGEIGNDSRPGVQAASGESGPWGASGPEVWLDRSNPVDSIAVVVPMPLEAIIDSEYLVWSWERMRMLMDGLPRPSIAERIRGRQTVEGPSGYDHDFDIGWRAWVGAKRAALRRTLDVKRRIRRYVHDQVFAGLCDDEED